VIETRKRESRGSRRRQKGGRQHRSAQKVGHGPNGLTLRSRRGPRAGHAREGSPGTWEAPLPPPEGGTAERSASERSGGAGSRSAAVGAVEGVDHVLGERRGAGALGVGEEGVEVVADDAVEHRVVRPTGKIVVCPGDEPLPAGPRDASGPQAARHAHRLCRCAAAPLDPLPPPLPLPPPIPLQGSTGEVLGIGGSVLVAGVVMAIVGATRPSLPSLPSALRSTSVGLTVVLRGAFCLTGSRRPAGSPLNPGWPTSRRR
jgi:hypothetical protein